MEPLKSIVAKEVLPGPECETDEDLKAYVKKTLSTVWRTFAPSFHPLRIAYYFVYYFVVSADTVGTASMLPRNKNGVVDSRLRVYGTKNIRVADLSIVPLHIAAHTQSTAYNIGEQGK